MKTQHTPKLPECFKGEFFVEVLENDDTGENTFNIMSDIPSGALCEVINDTSEDVAHEIVKRVNLHDELVQALDDLMHESPEPITKKRMLEINSILKRAKA